MKKLKGLGLATTLLLSAVLLSSCSSSSSSTDDENAKLTVGASPVPHAEILRVVEDDLLEQGIELEIVEFSDYALVNPATVDGSLDANFFQHGPYLETYNNEHSQNLVSVGPVHIEPLGIYSQSISSLDELKEEDKVSIPSDPTNETRALELLEENEIITLDKEGKEHLTPIDIEENPLNLEFIELDSAQLPRTISEVAISVINTNYALEGGFDPVNDAIAIEDGETSPYSNVLVVNEGNENNEEILALYDALTSEEVKTFINENYGGAVIPAF